MVKFDPGAYGKPSRLRHGSGEGTVQQGSTIIPSTTPKVSSSDATTAPRPLTEIPDHPVIAPLEAGSTAPANTCSTALLENKSLGAQPGSNMKQDKSCANKNGGLVDIARRKGKKSRTWLEENKKPCQTVALTKTPINEQETQEQKLERLREQEMTKLGQKIRQHSAEPTTSPQALSLARQASVNHPSVLATPETPQATTVTLSPTINAQVNEAKNSTILLTGSGLQAKAPGSFQGPKNDSAKSSSLSKRGRGGSRFQNARRNRWATTAETRPPPASEKSVDSNAFGSEVRSDAETTSGDSIAALENGRLLRKNRPAGEDPPLDDWSGNWMSPPVDWDTRPRFNSKSTQFIAGFGNWNETTASQSTTGITFTRLSRDLVRDPDLHPDGLNLIDRTITVDVDTARQYGYSEEALEVIRRDAQLVAPDIFTDDWGKLDLRNPDNLKFHNECGNDLIRNYNANKARERQEEISMQRAQKLARRQAEPYVPAPNPNTPRINIYLRPAVRSDIPQLQDIYSHYVRNTVYTSEIHPIGYADMLDRWIASTDEKLPFIVAVSKSLKMNREVGNAVEKVVGWASATDFVNRNSVERFTVELDMYVHKDHLHQGVGKCLMDKLIDSTDRGHIARKGYPFTCAPELRHAYSAGGARDLMNLRVLVRSWDKPRNAKENHLPWIKKWLEDAWNFVQQGHSPKAGVKFKR